MNAVDTNILIYVNDPRDPVKQDIAVSVVEAMTDRVEQFQVVVLDLVFGSEFHRAEGKLLSYACPVIRAFSLSI
jgi:predicted nucleic acid-binding protein